MIILVNKYMIIIIVNFIDFLFLLRTFRAYHITFLCSSKVLILWDLTNSVTPVLILNFLLRLLFASIFVIRTHKLWCDAS